MWCLATDRIEEAALEPDLQRLPRLSPRRACVHGGLHGVCGACRAGVVDGTHQSLALLLAALGPREVNTVRLVALTAFTIQTLRHIKDFLGVEFDIKPEADSQTIFLSCVGFGMGNLGRRIQ